MTREQAIKVAVRCYIADVHSGYYTRKRNAEHTCKVLRVLDGPRWRVIARKSDKSTGRDFTCYYVVRS